MSSVCLFVSIHFLFFSFTNSLRALIAAGPEYKLLNNPTNTTTATTTSSSSSSSGSNDNSCCMLANQNCHVLRSNLDGDRRGHKCPPPYFFYCEYFFGY